MTELAMAGPPNLEEFAQAMEELRRDLEIARCTQESVECPCDLRAPAECVLDGTLACSFCAEEALVSELFGDLAFQFCWVNEIELAKLNYNAEEEYRPTRAEYEAGDVIAYSVAGWLTQLRHGACCNYDPLLALLRSRDWFDSQMYKAIRARIHDLFFECVPGLAEAET